MRRQGGARRAAFVKAMVVGLVGATALTGTLTGHVAAAQEAATTVAFADVSVPAGTLAPMVAESVAASPRSRFVDIDTSRLRSELLSDEVTFDLFDGVSVDFGGTGESSLGVDGNLTWSGTTPSATATLSFADDGVRGSIQSGDASYSIVPVDGTTHLLFEEGRVFPPTEEPLVPPDAPTWASDTPASAPAAGPFDQVPSAADGTPVIRVLTVFDDLSSTYYGGDANAVAELGATIDEVNAAYARSGVNLVMQSAAIERVSYASTQSAGTELNRVTKTTDGYLDEVPARRDALAADLVVFVTPLGGASCGQAWLLAPPYSSFDPAFGFGVVDPSCARGNLTFAHETGHNLGADHGPTGGQLGYNNGYINLAAGYRTVMSYYDPGCTNPCTRLPYFSSPSVLYNGQPTGSPTQDNARVLNEQGPYVSTYRTGGGPVTPPPVTCSPATGSTLVPLTPARLFDSRGPGLTVDGLASGSGARPAGSITEVQVAGRGCVPADATAVVLNVTVVQPAASGYASVFPCGEAVPNASNLNFAAGQNVPNAVVAKVGAGGTVCVFAEVPFDLLVDVNGFVPAGSTVGSLSPARLLDSRVGGGTIDGQLAGIGQRGAGSVTEVPIVGRGGVPADASAVILNVTVVQAARGGYASVYPCGQAVPNASNLNFAAGQTVPNAVVAKVGAGGKVCVFAEVPFDLLVDVNGFVPAGSTVGSLSPARSARLAGRWGHDRWSTRWYRAAWCRVGHRGSGGGARRGSRERDRRHPQRHGRAGGARWVCVGVPVWSGATERVEPQLRDRPDRAERRGREGRCGRQDLRVRRGAVRPARRRQRLRRPVNLSPRCRADDCVINVRRRCAFCSRVRRRGS